MTDTALATTELSANEALAIIGILGSFIFVFIAIGIILYVFQAMGLYRMSKNRGIEHNWFAWIPILQNYLLGELIENRVWGFGGAKWILVFGPIVTSFTSSYLGYSDNTFLTLIALIIGIAFYVYFECATYRLYKEYSTHAVVMIIFSIIFPFLVPIFIFAIRKHQYRAIR